METIGTLFPSLDTAAVIDLAARHLTPNYKPAPLVLVRGEGVRVFDRDGRSYLDMVGGIAVNSLGHGHPRLVKAIAEQAATLIHVSNLYLNEAIAAFSDRLSQLTGFERVFVANSGAEANEAALKCARRYQTVVRGRPDKTGVLAFHDSFHGRTFGALSVTGQPKYHQGFEPLVPGAVFASFGDLASVDAALAAGEGRIGAIIVEPIQCEGGINLPPAGFLEGLRERCSDHDIALIFDEVQTGVGRTGTWFYFQHGEGDSIRPDILTTAKGIAGGVPLGAMMTSSPFAEALQPGTHASTFGGNALACRAGLEVLSVIAEDGLLEHVAAMGERLHAGLAKLVGGVAVE
ncbi:MAG TPA: aminotransferase class III-fold pyridoxal phosphate-dependent enzyme, partial [Myxococcota bacterium]|nr:aminotransferase class III-fold pyridoxal phosphate-dependent enzyme [Myxococcota bacterium]